MRGLSPLPVEPWPPTGRMRTSCAGWWDWTARTGRAVLAQHLSKRRRVVVWCGGARTAVEQDTRELIREFERAGWKVVYRKNGYPRVLCPCGKHQRSIHKTPSNPNYGKDALQWLRRQSCYQEGRGR